MNSIKKRIYWSNFKFLSSIKEQNPEFLNKIRIKDLGHKVLRGLFLISFVALMGGYFSAHAQGGYQLDQTGRDLQGQGFLPALFYSVKKDGKTHYLLGTMHSPIPIQDLVCYRRVERAIQNSDQLFLETSVRKRLEEISQTIFPPSFYPDKVEVLIESLLATMESMDSQIEKLANNSGIPTVNLDNRELQDQLGNTATLTDTFELLRKLIPSLSEEDIERVFETAFIAFISPDSHHDYLQELVEMLTGNNLRSQNLDSKTLLIDRHEVWRTKFLQAHDDPENSSLFLIAGARHLIGPHNFIDVLSEDGFLVQRMDCGLNEFLSTIEEEGNKNESSATTEDNMIE